MMIKKDDTNCQLKQEECKQNHNNGNEHVFYAWKATEDKEFRHYLKFGGQTIGIKADLGAKPLVHYQYVPDMDAFVLQRAIKNRRNGTKDIRQRAVYFHTKSLHKKLGYLDSTDMKFCKKIDKIVEKCDLQINADYLNDLSLMTWARGIKTRELVEIKPRSDEESELADLLDRLHVSKSAAAPSSVVKAASLKKKQIIKFRLIVIERILKLLKDNEFTEMYDRYRRELIVNDQPESVLNMLVRLQQEVFNFDTIKTYRYTGGFVSHINRTYNEFKSDLISHNQNGFEDSYDSDFD
jgi:hypothetical protein